MKEMREFLKQYFFEVNLVARYLFLILISILILEQFFSFLLEKVFLWICYFLLTFFTEVVIQGNTLLVGDVYAFSIVEECIASSAYLLFTFVFGSMPLIFSRFSRIWFKAFFLFTLFNLMRILILMVIHIWLGVDAFEKVHLIFYQFLSGVVTALIIIYLLKKEKIKGIYPFYSDLQYLYKESRKSS